MTGIEQLATLADVAEKTFDYIIIGGGTAGCVLANRLSEDPNVTVVILEAGKSRFDDPIVTTPMGWMHQVMNPEYNWLHPVAPQAGAKNAHQVPWFRGKSLGGTSAINIMAYTKPSREEIDALEALGNPGWNYATYQKYAQKVERFRAPKPAIMDPEYRDLYNPASVGHDGQLTLSFLPTGSNAESAYQKALAATGLDILTDALGGDVVGIWKGLSSVDPDTGKRVDAATAYLSPVLARRNLKVLTEAFVHRVVTEETSKGVAARAVEFEHGGATYKVFTTQEVILSAGAIKTPQILELSGIGDRKILEPLGIKPVLHLPTVGTNAQEHFFVSAPIFRMRDDKGIITTNMLLDPAFLSSTVKRLNLAVDYSILINSFAFAPLQIISPDAAAIIETKKAYLARVGPTLPAGLRKQYELQLQILESSRGADIETMSSAISIAPRPEMDKPYMGIHSSLTHPWSRGSIHIASADPKAQPHIDPAYFQDPTDLDVLAEGFKYALRIANTEPFKSLVQEQIHPPSTVDLSSDEKIKEWVSGNITSTWHTCGTAAMLPRELGGVVDPQLKVYGTANIRVMDLSVLPLQIAVHPQALIYSMAEQAADIIKGTYSV